MAEVDSGAAAGMPSIVRRYSMAGAGNNSAMRGHELLVQMLISASSGSKRHGADSASEGIASAYQHQHQSHPHHSASLSKRPSLADAPSPPAHGSIVSPTSNTIRGDLQHQQTSTPTAHASIPSPTSAVDPKDLSWSLFRDTDYQAYLDHLTSSTLDSLRTEPLELQEEAKRIEAQLADLAFTEHRSFLDANACSRSIRSTFDGLESKIGALMATIPDLESACRVFEENSIRIMADRKRMSVVLANHARLLEGVLEIPQLMDTFIRNGYYEEAMDLQTHVGRLVLRHPDVPVIAEMAQEVKDASALMLSQLITLLRSNAKLPMCIRVIGYLRRMEAFPEPELRLVFLQQKDAFLSKLVVDLRDPDPAEFMKKYIEVLREHLFDIITQFKTIFPESTFMTSAGTPTVPGAGLMSSSVASTKPSILFLPASNSIATSAILSSYVTYRVHSFVQELRTRLDKIPDPTSLITQTMYFGMSLGRVGIDFRECVVTLFEEAIEKRVRRCMEAGVEQFGIWARGVDATGAVFRDFTASLSGRRGQLLMSLPEPVVSNTAVAAPSVLLSYPPLARLLNAFFNAFNMLRVMAPVALHDRLAKCVGTCLRDSMEIIRDLGVMLREKGGEEEEWGPDFGETCKVAVEALVPAVINAFENHVYGSVVGISEGGPLADSKWIKEPILEFIPKVIAPPPVIDPVPAGRSALAEQVNGVKDRREADTSGDAVEAVPGGVAEADGAVAVAEVTEVVANNNE